MAEGWRMWAISLLTIVMFLLPLLSAAPLDIAGDVKKEDVKADNDGMHGHDENVTRRGKFFGHNRFDMGDMNISGSVVGDVVSIGHKVNIDVHDHHHHEDDTVIECKEGLRILFKSIDSNKNGLMDAKELVRVCHQNNIQITKSSAVRILTLQDKTVGFNMAKFCELLKDCQSTNSADILYFLLQLDDRGCEDTCTAVWSPVCGVDGKTYSNTCKACGIEVACDGLCPCNAKFPCEFDDGLLSPQFQEGGQLSPYDTSRLFKWENNVIPYYYTNKKTTDGDKALVRSVMDRFEAYTCFTFIEEDEEDVDGNKHRLEIDIGDDSCRGGIAGYVMKAPYREETLLFKLTAHVTNKYGEDECGTVGLIIHELMHVVGVGHTQRRNDRDNFIRVNLENLDGADKIIKDQYKKCQDCILFDRIPYDCGSIMHYGTHFEGKEVIEPKDEETCILTKGPLLDRVWNAPAKDWELLNIIGNCPETTSVQAASANINYATEMPNIGKLFQGYDIMKGNPLPVEPFPVDPGFREPIFKPIYSGSPTADRRYLQPDGTTISSCKGACSLKFSSTEISGSKSYQESLATKVGFSVGGSIGAWGGKFSASYGYKEVAEKTSSASNLFTLSSASCCAYSAELLSYNLPPLSQNFLSGVQTLTEKYDAFIYLNFIKAFGTHFIKNARMGSLYGKQSEISKLDWATMLEKGIDIGIAAEISAYGVTASSDVSQNHNVKNAEIFSSKAKKQKVFTMGVKPPADGKKGTWLQKTISDPAPIELTLGGSLLDLFEHDDIKAKVSTAVKANMKKALDNYCGLLLKSGEAKTCSSPGADPPFPSPRSGSCEVHVGPSTSNTISVIVSEGCVCPTVVNKGTWLGDDTYPDEFKVTQDGSLLQVRRTDSNIGWSMDLSFKCFRDTLYKGQKLKAGQFLRSDNGDYEFLIQDDGNMVIYQIGNSDRGPTWESDTKAGPGSVLEFIFQEDGNLVLYNNEKYIWASGTSTGELLIEKTTADALVMKDDGILVLNSTTGDVLWASNQGYRETPGINLDALTSWGKWGEVQKCSYPHFVNKMDLKYEHGDIFQDDTALNAIRLTCTDGLTISSTEGHWGVWGIFGNSFSKKCPEGKYINAAQIRSEAVTDGDDTAANGIRFKCTDGSKEYRPWDGDWGSWRPWKSCLDGSAIYGIQTLVEPPIDGDDTALNNVKFFCARLP